LKKIIETAMHRVVSKSEKKRRAKSIEKLVLELFELSPNDLGSLPCETTFREEIAAGKGLGGGARKRQAKYLAKVLRQEAKLEQELLTFLQKRKGSKLKEVGEFHELERLRASIINDAIAMHGKQTVTGRVRQPHRSTANVETCEAIEEAVQQFPELNPDELRKTALMYARTRKPLYNRELFRMLKSALERRKFAENG